MSKNLNWIVLINNNEYNVNFVKDMSDFDCDYPKIRNIYEVERDSFEYLLVTLETGIFKLYSKQKRKLYLQGASKRLRWISVVSEETH